MRFLEIQNLLNRHVPNPQPSLTSTDPYTHLIAVLLSARCTDARVNKVTPRLFARARTPLEMTQLSAEEIIAIVRPCGLSARKGRDILELSHILLIQHDGIVPSDRTALEAFPGVGRKTASVVLAQVFGQSAFPVDTHIARCARRWKISMKKSPCAIEKDCVRFFGAEADLSRLHLQIILYARQHCPARGHILEKCPICMCVN